MSLHDRTLQVGSGLTKKGSVDKLDAKSVIIESSQPFHRIFSFAAPIGDRCLCVEETE